MSQRRGRRTARDPGRGAEAGRSLACRRSSARGAAVGLALGAAGCAEPPALDLVLVPDPNINTTEQLLTHVQRAALLVDAEEGLYAPGEERLQGDVQVKNTDVDPALELVVSLTIARERLPRIRIEQGGLPDVPLDIRVLGLASGEQSAVVARGELMGARLAAPPAEMTVPFNLRPEVRPPRVEQVLPADGSTAHDCVVPSLVISFSRPIDATSLSEPGVIAITPDPGPIEVAVDPSGLVANVATPRLAGDTDRLAYRVTISSAARDRTGQPLDQAAAEAGEQGYVGDFSLPCGPPPNIPEPPPCWLDHHCPVGALCAGGACIPVRCRETCLGGRVCDPLRAACVDDCRAQALFSPCAPDQRCDAASGLCR
ncbi:Ig-like domain-containing protein [Sorangium sp. So ce542]|uniref:Ig-like domain-containing protein n=1 Tax=Sorangium sp. So ce542 TaxID=3133316 RepID=UPI003F61316A